jgi:hypothetical protein
MRFPGTRFSAAQFSPAAPKKQNGFSPRISIFQPALCALAAAMLALLCCPRAKGDLTITTSSGSESATVTDGFGDTNTAGNSGANESSLASINLTSLGSYESDQLTETSTDMYSTSAGTISEQGGTVGQSEPYGPNTNTDSGTATVSISFTDSIAQVLTISGQLEAINNDFYGPPTFSVTTELTENGEPDSVSDTLPAAPPAPSAQIESVFGQITLQPGQTYTLTSTASSTAPFSLGDGSSTSFQITAAVPEPATLIMLPLAGVALLPRRGRSK